MIGVVDQTTADKAVRVALRGDFLIDVAKGLISGHSLVGKFGYNAAVGTTTETVWAQQGRLTYVAANTTMTISSEDADDTILGNGARTVKVTYQDVNNVEKSVTVDMNGQTGVTVATDMYRVYRAQVILAGATGTNEGDIRIGTGTITSGVPAVVHTAVIATEGQTNQAFYTIPAGKTGYMLSYYTSVGKSNNDGLVDLFACPLGQAWVMKEHITLLSTPFTHEFKAPRTYTAGTDLEARATSTAGTVDVPFGFDILLVDD